MRWGKIQHSSEAEQPRTDGGPSRQGKACQHRRGRGLAGAHPIQSTPQEETLQQDPNTLASCAKGTYGPGQPHGRAGTGQHKPWQQPRGYDWSETPPATPPPRGPTQSTPGRGHTGATKAEIQQQKNSYSQTKELSTGTTHRKHTGLHRILGPEVQSKRKHQHSNLARTWYTLHRPGTVIADTTLKIS